MSSEILLYKRHIEDLRSFQNPYRIVEYSSRIIVTSNVDGTDIKREFVKNFYKTKGLHIVAMTYNSVRERMESGLYVPKNTDIERFDAPNSFYNEDILLEMSSGSEIIAVDINSCYFNTLFQLGAISEKVYKAAFRKKSEYKDARNIAVGSLGRVGYITEYDGEKEMKGIERRNTAVVRLDVIDTVYNRCLEIARALESDFLFFLTDCFFIRPSGLEKLKTLLDSHLYTYKTENIRLVGTEIVGREHFNIRWLKSGATSESYVSFIRRSQYLYDLKNI